MNLSLKDPSRTEGPRLELRVLGWPGVRALGWLWVYRLPEPLGAHLSHSNLSLGVALTTVPAGSSLLPPAKLVLDPVRLYPAPAFKALPLQFFGCVSSPPWIFPFTVGFPRVDLQLSGLVASTFTQ